MTYQLRDYQEASVQAGVSFLLDKKVENGVLVAPTASGKSLIISNIVHRLGEPCLVLQPSKELLEQNFEKFESYGERPAIYSTSVGEKTIGSQITLATIGSIRKCPEKFGHIKHIIIDECFPIGSDVDGVPIEKISIGDMVRSFNHDNNSIELKKVLKVFKTVRKNRMVEIVLSNGIKFICTENHPIFTKNCGYVAAHSIVDMMSSTSYRISNEEKKLQLLCVRGGLQAEKSGEKQACLLQSGVCAYSNKEKNNHSKNICELRGLRGVGGTVSIQEEKNGKRAKSVLQQWVRKGLCNTKTNNSEPQSSQESKVEKRIVGKDEIKKSDVDGWCERKNDRILEREDVSVSRREREINKAANDASFRDRVSNGIPNKHSQREASVSICSKMLQTRFGLGGEEDCDRGGRGVAQAKKVEVFRPQKNRDFEFVGVESCKIYKPRGGRGCKKMRGKNYVYNLEVEDNHNYFVSNTLVHNCHHFVNPAGGMVKDFLKIFPHVKVLGTTATAFKLYSNSPGSELRWITRTSPKIFNKVVHVIQIQELLARGFLAKLEYKQVKTGFNPTRLRIQKNGADYTDESVRAHFLELHFSDQIVRCVNRLLELGRDRSLVFTRFVEEAEYVAARVPGAAVVSADTPKKERAQIVADFKSGKIPALCNVGIFCLDDKTEILTDSGWVGIDEMTYQHKAANWNFDNSIIFNNPKNITKRERSVGENMVFNSGVGKDFRVTGNHTMIYRKGVNEKWTTSPAEKIIDKAIKIPVSGFSKPFNIEPDFTEITKKQIRRREVALAYSYRKRGASYQDSNKMAAETVKRNSLFRPKKPSELTLDECSFIGFWLGDGSICKSKSNGNTACYLCQSMAYPIIVNWVDSLLKRIGFGFSRSECDIKNATRAVRWNINKGTGSRCQKREYGYYAILPYLNKEGSQLLWGLNEHQFAAMLHGFWLADGNHGDGVTASERGKNVTGTQLSLYNLIQAVGVCRGYSMSITKQGAPKKSNWKQQYSISWKLLQTRHFLRERAKLEPCFKPERVWCITSDTGFIITRRNGKVLITGNSMGFDYPALSNVILAAPTMSLARYYQWVGRVLRPHPSKSSAFVIDLVGLVEKFGRIEDLQVGNGGGNKWFIHSNGKQLTNVYFPR